MLIFHFLFQFLKPIIPSFYSSISLLIPFLLFLISLNSLIYQFEFISHLILSFLHQFSLISYCEQPLPPYSLSYWMVSFVSYHLYNFFHLFHHSHFIFPFSHRFRWFYFRAHLYLYTKAFKTLEMLKVM